MQKFHLLKKFESNNWAGGVTTPLFIYPTTADYTLRNFQFRLSTATVNIDQSEFTSLPGVSRKLMVLTGKTKLSHQNQHTKTLEKFEVDEFKGDWKTTSFGKCTDFNLMTTGNTRGELDAIVIQKSQNITYSIENQLDWLFIYLHKGQINIELNDENHLINQGNLLVLNELKINAFKIDGIKNSELIFTEIIL